MYDGFKRGNCPSKFLHQNLQNRFLPIRLALYRFYFHLFLLEVPYYTIIIVFKVHNFNKSEFCSHDKHAVKYTPPSLHFKSTSLHNCFWFKSLGKYPLSSIFCFLCLSTFHSDLIYELTKPYKNTEEQNNSVSMCSFMR